MIDTTTALILGCKMSKKKANQLRDEHEHTYYKLINNEFLHELSQYEESDVYFGMIVKCFDTDEPFAFCMDNGTANAVSTKHGKELLMYAMLLKNRGFINKDISDFKLYIINKLS